MLLLQLLHLQELLLEGQLFVPQSLFGLLFPSLLLAEELQVELFLLLLVIFLQLLEHESLLLLQQGLQLRWRQDLLHLLGGKHLLGHHGHRHRHLHCRGRLFTVIVPRGVQAGGLLQQELPGHLESLLLLEVQKLRGLISPLLSAPLAASLPEASLPAAGAVPAVPAPPPPSACAERLPTPF